MLQVYLIIRDLAEAQYVCDYILHGGSREEFLRKFSKAISQGMPCCPSLCDAAALHALS